MKLNHVAMVARSQENADRFYEGILQLTKIKTSMLTSDLARKIFGLEVECPLILYGNEAFAIEIFVTERIPVSRSPFAHTCLQVEDREAFIKTCRSAGATVNLIPRGEWQLCFVRDFDGNLFEIK
ncbi:MAG: VOC family protein [Deltaproteobacteria bacterium]|nr:VOC family protein [Deltaproteobacteria bacterium]